MLLLPMSHEWRHMKKSHRKIASAVFLVGVLAGLLSGCAAELPSSSTAAGDTVPPSPTSSPDPAATVACAVLSSILTSTNNALIQRDLGETTDAQAAAVIGTVKTALNGMQRNTYVGLQGDISDLVSAISNSAPTIPGADFDPHAPAFAEAVRQVNADCKANGTEIVLLGLPGQG